MRSVTSVYDVRPQNFMCAEFVKCEKDLVNEERFADLRVKSAVGQREYSPMAKIGFGQVHHARNG